MKSTQKAEEKLNNPCNSSTSKYQYSFGRDRRFKDKNKHRMPLDVFYDLPSHMSKKGGVISRAPRDCQKSIKSQLPPPGTYDPKEIKGDASIVFAPGRERCKVSSIFYNTTISYPGPGCYNPRSNSTGIYPHMAGKCKTSYQTISPGPKYSFQSTLLDRNKILSNLKRTAGVRLVLPNNQSRVTVSQEGQSKQTLNRSITEVEGGYISYKGHRMLGKSGKKTIIGRQQRFRPASAKQTTPGPGHYSSFSEFIESVKL